MITFEEFKEKFFDLSMGERLSVYNNYCSELDNDGVIEYNEGYNLEVYFEDIWDALRAAEYGDYRCCDEFFSFDGRGNLVSFDDSEAMVRIENVLDEIYEDKRYWEDYIELEHTEDDEDEEGE